MKKGHLLLFVVLILGLFYLKSVPVSAHPLDNRTFTQLDIDGNKPTSISGVQYPWSSGDVLTGVTVTGTSSTGVYIRNIENFTLRNCKIYNIGKDGIQLSKAKNITIENCEIYNTGSSGIDLSSTVGNDTQNVHILNNRIHDTDEDGIHSSQANDSNNNITLDHRGLVIRGNTVYNSGGDSSYHNIYVQSSDPLIENNRIYGAKGNGITTRSTAIIRNNIVGPVDESCYKYFSDHIPGPSNTWLAENNFCYLNNTASVESGIKLGRETIKGVKANNYIIRFNSIYVDSSTRYGFQAHPDFNSGNYSIKVYGNVFVSPQSRFWDSTGMDVNEKNFTSTSANNVFKNVSTNFDLHLAANNSPPIGFATGLTQQFPTTDIDNQSRSSSRLDAGADQFNGNPAPLSPSPTGISSASPTPTGTSGGSIPNGSVIDGRQLVIDGDDPQWNGISTLSGVTVRNYQAGDLIVIQDIENFTLKDCHVYNGTYDGIKLQRVKNVRIENCEIHNLQLGSGIDLSSGEGNNTRDVTLINNHIYQVRKDGINAAQRNSGNTITVDHPGLKIIGNTIHDIGDSSHFRHGLYIQSTDPLIEGNRIYNTDANGISVRSSAIIRKNNVSHPYEACIKYFSDHLPGPSNKILIENNFCFMDNSDTGEAGIRLASSDLGQKVSTYIIRFNSVYTNVSKRYGIRIPIDYDGPNYDIQVYGNAVVHSADPLNNKGIEIRYMDRVEKNYTSQSPDIFKSVASATNYDLHLKSTSVAAANFATGLADFPNADIDGQSRTASRLDAGADQISNAGGVTASPTPTIVNWKRLLASWLNNLYDRNSDQKFNTLDWVIHTR